MFEEHWSMRHVFDFHLLGSAGRHDWDLLNPMMAKCSAGAFGSVRAQTLKSRDTDFREWWHQANRLERVICHLLGEGVITFSHWGRLEMLQTLILWPSTRLFHTGASLGPTHHGREEPLQAGQLIKNLCSQMLHPTPHSGRAPVHTTACWWKVKSARPREGK